MIFVNANEAPIGSFAPELNGFVEEVMVEPTGCVDCGEFDYLILVTDKDTAKLEEWTIAKDHTMAIIEMKGN